jgi:hypothetical protein
MKCLIAGPLLILLLAAPAAAQTLGERPPLRDFTLHAIPPVDPDVVRQGGDTWEDAVPIPAVPYLTTGTNVGYPVSCCLEMCPYEAWGPAVYYSFVPDQDLIVRIDLCGSDFDTGLYVFDANQSEVACNVDFYLDPPCGRYVSCIERAELHAGEFYYIVVTGQSGDSGNYVLEMTRWQPCVVTMPAGAIPEGEPPLGDDYQDAHNGGCNSPQFGNPFQGLVGDEHGELVLAGVSGWYQHGYQSLRDTDWFTAVVGPGGTISAALLAEQDSYLYELAPQDCNGVAVAQQATTEGCTEGTLTIGGAPGTSVWLWAGPHTFSPPYGDPNVYDYLLILSGLAPGPVTTEPATWSTVRALFR